jgi:hypothetical protein
MPSNFSNLDKFLANFDGGARPNRYQVELSGVTLAGAGQVPQSLSFLCRSTSIPTSNLGICRVMYMGREAKISGDKVFDDWSITVYNNIDWDVRGFFERWVNGMLNHRGNTTKYQEDAEFFGNAKVMQLDRNENIIHTYEMKGVWPTSLGEIALAYDSNDLVEEFAVTFAVNWWTSDSTPDNA